MKYAYFNYDPVGPSIFFYTDDEGTPKETHFNIDDTDRLVEAISASIQTSGADHLVCNSAAIGLKDSINKYLAGMYGYTNPLVFELNN